MLEDSGFTPKYLADFILNTILQNIKTFGGLI